MNDLFKIVIGLVLFFGLFSIPFWAGSSSGGNGPEIVVKEGTEACVESKEFMRPNHMHLLDQWRDSVVRDNDRVYTNASGKHFEKSLTKTCLNCHSNKEEFCDRCHDYMGVKPYCWSCHLSSEEQI
ncbi:MAG: sulfate reduction electron transfer complex DsrMKJOP subunit DsrJ [Deltaproteobacteria bacterium]|nr:sulfate reduction electron transfer complex DsrMKJOP subunit DsrJ [Deltaproteobacteria bacterium]